jgi:hypothetical protein
MSRSAGVRSLRNQKTALWMNIGVSLGLWRHECIAAQLLSAGLGPQTRRLR